MKFIKSIMHIIIGFSSLFLAILIGISPEFSIEISWQMGLSSALGFLLLIAFGLIEIIRGIISGVKLK